MEDCRKCGISMSLNDGCDPPEDPRLNLCWGCLAELAAKMMKARERLLKANARLRKQLKLERDW